MGDGTCRSDAPDGRAREPPEITPQLGLSSKGLKTGGWLSPTWGCCGGTSADGLARHWTCVRWTRVGPLYRPAPPLFPDGLGFLQKQRCWRRSLTGCDR